MKTAALLAPPTAASLAAQAISTEVLLEKYAKGDERTIADVRQRVARALAAAEAPEARAHWEERFLRALQDGFIPAERAIEWSERGLRLSPFDPWRSSAFVSVSLGHFDRGRYEEAAAAARKSIQFSPGFSISYMVLAAPLAKLGRLEEAKAAAARILQLQPGFRYGRHFAGLNCTPALAASLSEGLRAAGLPE
ncbi:MAG: hypothetical protein ACREXI_04060 [Caldimonas sp.]